VIVGNTVWRIKRRPVWVIWAAKDAALSVAEDPAWRQSARRSSHIELLSGPIIGRVESETVPGTRWWPGTGRRSGLKPPLPSAARLALAGERGGKDAEISLLFGVSGAAPGGWTRHNREFL